MKNDYQREPWKNIEIFPAARFQKNSDIHPSAMIGTGTEIGEGVKIGPYAIIGNDVKIGNNTVIFPHAVINDNTVIGEDCQVYYGAVLGSESQDLKSTHEKSYVIIGNKNIIREYVTVNRSSEPEGKTILGDNNLLMSYVHIAHDCSVGDNNVMANSVNLGGHTEIANNVVIGGLVGIHQFVRVGSFAMIGGLTRVNQDIPPYFTTVGNPAKVEGVNLTGLKRNKFSKERLLRLKDAYTTIYNSNLNLSEAIQKLEEFELTEEIAELLSFYRSRSKRGITGLYYKT
jgi:UDP-N-acetylglucosamine acyltransferase